MKEATREGGVGRKCEGAAAIAFGVAWARDRDAGWRDGVVVWRIRWLASLAAGADVEKMKIELKDKEKTLVVAQEKSAVLLQEITACEMHL